MPKPHGVLIAQKGADKNRKLAKDERKKVAVNDASQMAQTLRFLGKKTKIFPRRLIRQKDEIGAILREDIKSRIENSTARKIADLVNDFEEYLKLAREDRNSFLKFGGQLSVC